MKKRKPSIVSIILAIIGLANVILVIIFSVLSYMEDSDRLETAIARIGFIDSSSHGYNWAKECKAWPEEGEFVSWNEVSASWYSNGTSSRFGRRCPGCGKTCLRIKYTSPKWTWEQGIGREGTIEFCPTCHKQYSLSLDKTNQTR